MTVMSLLAGCQNRIKKYNSVNLLVQEHPRLSVIFYIRCESVKYKSSVFFTRCSIYVYAKIHEAEKTLLS